MNHQFPYEIDGGVLYRNPHPHARSLHAYFPSIVTFDAQHLGASVVLGQAFEAADLHLVYFQSLDGGKSWERLSSITSPCPDMSSSTVGRIVLTQEGDLVANVARHQRRPDDTGLTKEGSLAFVETTLELYRSKDQGANWRGPEVLCTPPVLGDTSFEECSPIRILANGDWFWPTSTWPTGEVTVRHFITGGLVSKDRGATWQHWQQIYPNNDLIYWESKVTPLEDGRLLSTSWVHELASGRDLPNHYAIGNAEGTQWSAPASTELNGQTMETVTLPDNRVLAIYRRVDQPGIWAAIAQVNDSAWCTETELLLWGGPTSQANAPMRDAFATLKCGAPSAQRLEDGRIVILFWAVVDQVSQINTLILTPKYTR